MKQLKIGEYKELSDKEKNKIKRKLETKFKKILFKDLMLDENDDNFKKTPKRIAKMLVDEVFNGLYSKPPEVSTFEAHGYKNHLVVLGPMKLKSMCAHHWMPFFGEVYFAYVVKDKLVGASKPERVLKWLAAKPHTQELLLQEFVEYMSKVLNNEDVMAVATNVHHTCMSHRGVETCNGRMTNSIMYGKFLKEIALKNEVMKLINVNNNHN